MQNYLRDYHEDEQYESNDQVHPKQPSQEREVGSHDRAEVRLYLLDAELPGYQKVGGVSGLSLQLMQFLNEG